MSDIDVYAYEDVSEAYNDLIQRMEAMIERNAPYEELVRCWMLDELYAEMLDSDWPAAQPERKEEIPF